MTRTFSTHALIEIITLSLIKSQSDKASPQAKHRIHVTFAKTGLVVNFDVSRGLTSWNQVNLSKEDYTSGNRSWSGHLCIFCSRTYRSEIFLNGTECHAAMRKLLCYNFDGI